MKFDFFKKKKKGERQSWQPHWSLRILYKLWMIVFAAAKIAVGAVATVALICVICVLVFAGVLAEYLESDVIPNSAVDLDDVNLSQTSYVYYEDSDGDIQRLQQIFTEENRKYVVYEDIPQDLINAAVAIEDKRFYEHQGVDWVTTMKACLGMFFGDADAGGSTITQQLVKNTLDDRDYTVQRKVLEWFRAAYVEKNYDKDYIMERYLNAIYLGQKCYGVRSAAEKYFGKELEMLTTAECASLIGITNNPSLFDPYSTKVYEYKGDIRDGRSRNRYRQEIILSEMHDQGMLTDQEYEEAMAQEMVFKSGVDFEDRLATCANEDCGYKNTVSTYTPEGELYVCPNCGTANEFVEDASLEIYSYYVDTVLEDVAKALAAKDGITDWNKDIRAQYIDIISKSGFHIYSCLNMDVQNQVDAIYTNLEEIPKARSGQQLQSGIVVIDNDTGYIIAMSGGVGEKTVHDAFNRATDSALQTGSSIKPVSVYSPAFEAGAISPVSVVKDMPLYYNGNSPFPRNDNRKYSYSRTILSAVEDSVNAVAANVVDMIGPRYSFDFARDKFGLSGLLEDYVNSSGKHFSDIDIAPLALGAQTKGISIRDMAAGFATFANEGVYREGLTWTKVYDSEGNLVLDNTQDTREILSQKTVDYMNYCLQTAVASGTGTTAQISGQTVAGKTGTTGDNKDRWFCGYTAYYTAAVWCGYDTPEVINLVGDTRNPAARLWQKVMAPIHQGLDRVSLYNSGNMKSVEVCLDSGLLVTDACQADIRTDDGLKRVESARAYREDFPTDRCEKHVMVEYCTEGKGVANEYCKLFAEDGTITLSEKGLVKMTQEEIDELLKAEGNGLNPEYLRDDYIYFINDNGSDGEFKGLHGDINKDVSAPYLVCTAHTQESWEAHQASQQPTVPEFPDLPTLPDVSLPWD